MEWESYEIDTFEIYDIAETRLQLKYRKILYI